MNILDLFKLDGKVAVVTGAAGQLGFGFSKALAEAGAVVLMADLELGECREKEKLLRESGSVDVYSLELDVAQAESIKSMTKQVLMKFKKIDILINNAGVGVYTPFSKRTSDEYNIVMDVNVRGTLFCTQIISKEMQTNGGSIINIGSIYGLVSPDPAIYGDSGRNSSEVYGASKAAIIQMTKYFAVHLAKFNIRVNCLSPGGVFASQKDSFVNNYNQKAPLGRMAKESDLSGALVFLASEASSYMTGHNLVVDGGFTIW